MRSIENDQGWEEEYPLPPSPNKEEEYPYERQP